MTSYDLYPEAESDLENIWQYSIENWGTERALDYLDDIDRVFQLLATSPLISREHTEFNSPVHIHPHLHHLIVYIVTDNGISIVRVLHESMNVPVQLENE